MSVDKKKTGLGRGLSSLIGGSSVETETRDSVEVIEINLDDIKPNPYQPRQAIPVSSLVELADSIKEHGVLQPIQVIRDPVESGKYIVAAGERRVSASKLAGLKTIPAIIREYTNEQLAEIAIVENVHRKDLNPIEEGYAFLRLNVEFNYTYELIAQKVNKTVSYVENKIRLTKLPKLIQNAITTGEITEMHGKALLSLNDEQAMIAALKIVLRNNLTAKKTEELVHQIRLESQKSKNPLRASSRILWEQKYSFIKEDLEKIFGWKVKLKKTSNDGGSLIINFSNDEELITIFEQLKKDI